MSIFVVGAHSIRPFRPWAYAIRPYLSLSTKTVREPIRLNLYDYLKLLFLK